MAWIPDLSRRQMEPELMDDPELDRGEHVAALQGLSRLNRLSLSSRIVWRPIRRLAAAAAGGGRRPLRVLDIATGSGDIPVDICRLAARRRLPLEVTAVDISERAIESARRRAERAGVELELLALDILRAPLRREFDVVMCSLFLHHLADNQALDLLKTMACLSTQAVLVNDLCRSRRGYLLAYWAARLFSRSPVVHVDGPLSVRAAFTKREARDLAERAGLPHAVVRSCWPCRFLLEWHHGEVDESAEPSAAVGELQPMTPPA